MDDSSLVTEFDHKAYISKNSTCSFCLKTTEECICKNKCNRLTSIMEINECHAKKCRELSILETPSEYNIYNGLDISAVNKIKRECRLGCFTGTLPSDEEDHIPPRRRRILARSRLTRLNFTPGHVDNERWNTLSDKIEPYLDVKSLLMLRMTCKVLYFKRFKLHKSVVCFRGFAGYTCHALFGLIMPLVRAVYRISSKQYITLDFSHVIDTRDVALVYLFSQNHKICNLSNKYIKNLKELVLDFCTNITDQGLLVLLKNEFPNLEYLSVACVRNENFTGEPFVHFLSRKNWPKFQRFNCTCSSINLDAVSAIADFFIKGQDTENISNYTLEICGSWASRMFLDKMGFGPYITAFSELLAIGNLRLCSRLTKKMQHDLDEAISTDPLPSSLEVLMQHQGSSLLSNTPIVESDKSIWTLPICIAIKTNNTALFNMLIRRGARLNVWDYIGKSPLFTACQAGNLTLVKKMLKCDIPAECLGVGTCIGAAIQSGNIELLDLLLSNSMSLGESYYYIRNYKSPLYIACTSGLVDAILLLLKHGANPNWCFHRRSSPTLVAYQSNPQLLETFLKYGAGTPKDKRWVLVEVMGCAAARGDLESIELLIKRYPELIESEHEIWSRPLIQASRLGNVSLVQLLLEYGASPSAFDTSKNTALHVAAEEGVLNVAKILIEHGCNLDAVNSRGYTPLHLACMENKHEIVDLLIQSKCNINVPQSTSGETPLMTCIKVRNETLALKLIQSATVDQLCSCDAQKRNALVYCLFFSQYRVGEGIMNILYEAKIKDSIRSLKNLHEVAQERLTGGTVDHKAVKKFMKQYHSRCAPQPPPRT
ncbi:bifunctional Ankyrin repeat-containing domain superfamily/Ankyrin repeat/Leucine-rich repeat domain superfamily [Babesia duncani]|uniref:Bifunctional Ankyrin repeat-containing domain superfamily/Ankyrin repeat/Leucine-rich repeat domain superfamily n=1 Tax=Babesia duncani TaxID=323732 RepID=A0AAD9UP29_9APIC|nr:bifunctional Ankyrin repeat-containing domain superfamily/Ankyrin repeat/Leucine-rich repeat domain superfamily [Babesia duncani]